MRRRHNARQTDAFQLVFCIRRRLFLFFFFCIRVCLIHMYAHHEVPLFKAQQVNITTSIHTKYFIMAAYRFNRATEPTKNITLLDKFLTRFSLNFLITQHVYENQNHSTLMTTKTSAALDTQSACVNVQRLSSKSKHLSQAQVNERRVCLFT